MLALRGLSTYSVAGNGTRTFMTSRQLNTLFIEDAKRVEQERLRKQSGIVHMEVEHIPDYDVRPNCVFYHFIEQYHEVQRRQRIVENIQHVPKSPTVEPTSE